MAVPASSLQLKVRQIEQVCLFELTWGQGQTRSVEVPIPANLDRAYQAWRQAYLNYYRSPQMRGRPGTIMTIPTTAIDWRLRLSTAEIELLEVFRLWLQSGELYPIRAELAQAAAPVFLTCSSIELDRLPWELWNIAAEFSAQTPIRWIRAPLNISASAAVDQSIPLNRDRRRILAILGDDTGLNFEADREAVKSLDQFADIEFVGWQPGQTATQVIEQITTAIADSQGWDILFFAGHSNESVLTGGELGIAPGISINIRDIMPQLITAKANGLQVAIFNSCSGLSLAHSLIDLGLGQVVVMREPIHNQVAQVFLVNLLRGLADGQDIYDALQSARQFLQTEKRSIYPSAALVSSLFCHPGATLFKLQRSATKPGTVTRNRVAKSRLRIVPPVLLAGSLLLSLWPPVYEGLLAMRMLSQTVWRDTTGQMPTTQPAIAVVQIDRNSITQEQEHLTQLHPIDRTYLAKLVDRITARKAKVLGIDVVFDAATTPKADRALQQSLQRAVTNQTWVVFASTLDGDHEVGVSAVSAIASLNWSLQGYTNTSASLMELPENGCAKLCPMPYVMAIAQQKQRLPYSQLLPLSFDRREDLRHELFQVIAPPPPKTLLGLQSAIDFSIPPDRLYQKISASDLRDPQKFPDLSQQIVLIGAGCDDRLKYDDTKPKPDCEAAPLTFNYWKDGEKTITGAELLAYMTYQFNARHAIFLIPDAWMLLATLPLGLLSRWGWARLDGRSGGISPRRELTGWFTVTLFYGLISLQVYVSIGVLLPWLLPTLAYLSYSLSRIAEKSDG
jgi:CHASE2 domain/CHAT domain